MLSFVKDYISLMLLLVLLSYLVPKEEYRSYFHFFISVLAAVILLQPLLSVLAGADGEAARKTLRGLLEQMESYEYQEEGENLYEQFLGTTEEAE